MTKEQMNIKLIKKGWIVIRMNLSLNRIESQNAEGTWSRSELFRSAELMVARFEERMNERRTLAYCGSE